MPRVTLTDSQIQNVIAILEDIIETELEPNNAEAKKLVRIIGKLQNA